MKRKHLRWAFAALACACVLSLVYFAQSPRTVKAGEPRYFAIQNAKVFPVSGPPMDGATVVIADGLIQAVGKNVKIPPEALVIDGKGMNVYPGLIDAGTDIGVGEEKKDEGSAGGGGGRRRGGGGEQKISMGPEDRPGTTPWRVASDEFNAEDKRIGKWRDAGFTTVLSSPSGGMLPGQGSLMDLSDGRSGEMTVAPMAAFDLSFQATGGFWSFPGSLMGAIAYVRQVMWDTQWDAQASSIYNAHPQGLERPAYDRTEQIVAEALERKELFLVPANNQVQILRALRLIKEWKLRAAINGGQQGYAVAAEIGVQRIPVIVSLKWPTAPKDADPEAQTTLRELRFRGSAPSTPSAFARAGVKFAFSSGGLEGPDDIQKALKKTMDAGLSPDAALRALTMDAADIFGVEDRLGSIQPGKIANLLVTDGDLFNAKTKVKIVFVDGKRFEVHETPKDDKSPDKKAEKPAITDDVEGVVEGSR